jgi:hypothetical protein
LNPCRNNSSPDSSTDGYERDFIRRDPKLAGVVELPNVKEKQWLD